jgi:chromosome segregation ATPase
VLRVTSFALSGYVSAVDGYMSRFKRSVVDRLQPTMKLIERSIETNERQIAQIEQQKELERAREADLARRIRETEGRVAERRRKKQTARKARSRKPAH